MRFWLRTANRLWRSWHFGQPPKLRFHRSGFVCPGCDDRDTGTIGPQVRTRPYRAICHLWAYSAIRKSRWVSSLRPRMAMSSSTRSALKLSPPPVGARHLNTGANPARAGSCLGRLRSDGNKFGERQLPWRCYLKPVSQQSAPLLTFSQGSNLGGLRVLAKALLAQICPLSSAFIIF